MDGVNDPSFNGEFRLLENVLRFALSRKESITMFDIGANRGLVTTYAANIIGERGRIFAIEPCKETFDTLTLTTSNLKSQINLINAAFSDKEGIGALQMVGPNEGTNSLIATLSHKTTQTVELRTLDSFAISNSIKEIDFVKIDTEGHDFSVIQGSEEMLKSSRIGCIQFEYNWRWIGQRSYLKDVFDLVASLQDYRVGKVTPAGIEFYEKWTPEIETLIENNYAIMREDVVTCVSTIRSWCA
jgi:FkbM family methyltransferase